jgi:hypothetical protein
MGEEVEEAEAEFEESMLFDEEIEAAGAEATSATKLDRPLPLRFFARWELFLPLSRSPSFFLYCTRNIKITFSVNAQVTEK